MKHLMTILTQTRKKEDEELEKDKWKKKKLNWLDLSGKKKATDRLIDWSMANNLNLDQIDF